MKRQTPKYRHEKFDQKVLSHGFRLKESDKCLYSKFKQGRCVITCLYVDDMLVWYQQK